MIPSCDLQGRSKHSVMICCCLDFSLRCMPMKLTATTSLATNDWSYHDYKCNPNAFILLAWVDAVRHWAAIWVARNNAFTLLPVGEGKCPLVLPSKTAALQINWCSDWNTPAAPLPWAAGAECSADYGLWTKESHRPLWSTFFQMMMEP